MIIWTGLEAISYAASLQQVSLKEEWTIPSSWTLIAQMPFGKQNQVFAEKNIISVKEKLIVIR